MKFTKHFIVLLAGVICGCASQAPSNTANATTSTTSSQAKPAVAPPQGKIKIVRSRGGNFDGELIGTPAPGSKFSKLEIGMTLDEIQRLIGLPTEKLSHETGKRWIPFYFGNDARRIQVRYEGEGCLTFSGGNAWGGGENELMRITVDTKNNCLVD